MEMAAFLTHLEIYQECAKTLERFERGLVDSGEFDTMALCNRLFLLRRHQSIFPVNKLAVPGGNFPGDQRRSESGDVF